MSTCQCTAHLYKICIIFPTTCRRNVLEDLIIIKDPYKSGTDVQRLSRSFCSLTNPVCYRLCISTISHCSVSLTKGVWDRDLSKDERTHTRWAGAYSAKEICAELTVLSRTDRGFVRENPDLARPRAAKQHLCSRSEPEFFLRTAFCRRGRNVP